MIPHRMSDLSAIKTVGNCAPTCKERLAAIIEGTFLPAKSLGGWVWLDAPLRYISDHAKWRAAYYDQQIDDVHAGEPYVFVTCPFCGGSLPEPLLDAWPIDGETGG